MKYKETYMKPVVLVVEDNEKLNSMLKDVLESWGYAVLTETDGHSGLETAQSRLPDVIMLDIMLPGMSGYEVCSVLKGDIRTQSVTVIMFTALEDLESRIYGYNVGADNFLVKPVNYNEVKAIIQKSLADKLYRDTLENGLDVVGVTTKLIYMLTLTSISPPLAGQQRLHDAINGKTSYLQKC